MLKSSLCIPQLTPIVPTNRPTRRPTNQPTWRPTSRPSNRPTRLTDQPNNQATNQSSRPLGGSRLRCRAPAFSAPAPGELKPSAPRAERRGLRVGLFPRLGMLGFEPNPHHQPTRDLPRKGLGGEPTAWRKLQMPAIENKRWAAESYLAVFLFAGGKY